MNRRIPYKLDLLSKIYHGFEDLYDLGRDVYEFMDPDLSDCKDIDLMPDEFTGTVLVQVIYIPSKEDYDYMRRKIKANE